MKNLIKITLLIIAVSTASILVFNNCSYAENNKVNISLSKEQLKQLINEQIKNYIDRLQSCMKDQEFFNKNSQYPKSVGEMINTCQEEINY